MKKKLLTVILSCAMVCTSGVMAFATEDAPVVTADVLETAGVTVEDLEDVARYCKTVSEAGTADEYEREFRFASAAASLGSCEAMLWLGELYQGYKVEAANEAEDAIETAIYWWTQAAENGQPRGYANIGLLYIHDSVPGGGSEYGDIEYNEDTAFEYYQKSSDLGDSKAPRYVGLCYQNGVGTEVDIEKAFEYFTLAAERGDSTGTVYTADYLLEGKGTEQDIETAMSMYQEIVDTNGHDITLCAYKLGQIYEEGVYVEADAEKAAQYYQIVLDTTSSTDSEQAVHAQEFLDSAAK